MPNTLENIRNYAASLQGEERKSFIEKFNSIKDDDAKVETLGTRISSLSAPKRQFNTIDEAQAAMQNAQQEQQQAERNAKWMNVIGNANRGLDLGQAVNNYALPVVAGMGVGGTVVRGLAGAGAGLARQIGAGMAGGAAGGAVTGGMAPADNMQQRIGQAGLTAAAGGVLGGAAPLAGKAISNIGEAIRKLPTRFSDNKSVEFANKIRQAYTNTKSQAVKKFGSTLEDLAKNNPTKKIDLGGNSTIKSIIDDPDLSIEAKNVFNKTPILRDIIAGKKSEVTVKEAQDIANYLQFKVPANIKSQHLDITDVINEVKATQASAFPKEMEALRSEYAKVAQPFKDLKSQMKLQNVLSSIDRNFGGAIQRSQIKDLFADNPELLKEMGGYRNAGKLLKGIAIGGGIIGTAIGGKKALEFVKGAQ